MWHKYMYGSLWMAFVTHGAQNFCDNPRATRDILVAITTSVLDCCFLGTLLRHRL